MKRFRFLKNECMMADAEKNKIFLLRDDQYTTNGFICLENKYCTDTKGAEYVDLAGWNIIKKWKQENKNTIADLLHHLFYAEITQDAHFVERNEKFVSLDYPSIKDGQRNIQLKPADYDRLMQISEKIKFRLTGYQPGNPLQIVLNSDIIGVIFPIQ